MARIHKSRIKGNCPDRTLRLQHLLLGHVPAANFILYSNVDSDDAPIKMQSARARCTFHRNFEHFSAHIFSTIPQHNKYHRLMECIRLISIRIVGSSSPHASYGVKLPGEYDVRGIWIVNNILFSVCRPFRLGHLNLKIFASVGGIYRCAIPPRDQKIKTINERNAVSRLGQSSRLKGGAGRDNELKSIRIGEYVSKNGARYLRDD